MFRFFFNFFFKLISVFFNDKLSVHTTGLVPSRAEVNWIRLYHDTLQGRTKLCRHPVNEQFLPTGVVNNFTKHKLKPFKISK